MKSYLKFFAGAAALAIPMLAAAQATLPAPADARPSSTVLSYESAFADYKPYADLKTGDWVAMNNAVGSAGGAHTAHGMVMKPQAEETPPAPMKMAHKMDGGTK